MPVPQCDIFVGHTHLEKSSAQTHAGDSAYSHLGEKSPRNCVFIFPHLIIHKDSLSLDP